MCGLSSIPETERRWEVLMRQHVVRLIVLQKKNACNAAYRLADSVCGLGCGVFDGTHVPTASHPSPGHATYTRTGAGSTANW